VFNLPETMHHRSPPQYMVYIISLSQV